MTKYVGIDPSLTSAAVVVYDSSTSTNRIASFSSKVDGGTIPSRFDRLESLALQIVSFAMEGSPPDLVGIEGPAFSSNTGKVWDRAGLWWYVVQALLNQDIRVVEIPPTSRAKYATGSGTAGKDAVLLEVARKYPDFNVRSNDEADALVICALSARLDGNPFDGDIPKNKLDAVTKLQKDNKWEA